MTVVHSISASGAPLANLTSDDFTKPDYFYQMGKPPLSVDIMMSIPGISFKKAWANRVIVELDDLIQAKEASGRPQDKIDVEKLKEAEQLDVLDGK